jgi:endonuclease YncB( thermonuclease family)
MISQKKVKLTIVVLLAAIAAVAASKSQTFTGEVSDAMCGAKHMMAGKADCTRECVGRGSNYSLVVGDKVYTLHTTNKAATDQLSQLAGEQAKVTGTADGDTIEVSKVAASK